MTGCATTKPTTKPTTGNANNTPILVQSTSQQDMQLQRKILHAIADESRIDATRVAVTSNNGIVTLRGSVDTPLERQLAENVAATVDGVIEIRNLLTFS